MNLQLILTGFNLNLTMNKILHKILILSSLFLYTCQMGTAQTTFTFMGKFNKNGKPNYMDQPGDKISNTFLTRIQSSLPEYYPVPQYHPEYLLDKNTHDIKLKDTADVWITFVDEGAGYTNTLTYYTYDLNNPPTVKPTNLNVIFPNLSLENAVLKRGDKIFLGRFPKGKGIGFALIANGFQNETVTTGYNIFYSNPDFNPESNPAQRRHSVLLMDSTQKIVLGFEDLRRDNPSSDQDFNDAVFYVTAKSVGAAFGSFPITVGSIGTIGSGNTGGLESDGCLANAIASRNFKRAKTPSVSYDNPENLAEFKDVKLDGLQTRGDVELEQYIPENPLFEPTRAYITSPKDLIGITNAKKVLSVDYFDPATEGRLAAVLSSKTENKVYDHTKTICDRLVGSTLINTEIVTIQDMPFIRSTLLREDGTLEYTIAFAVCKDDAQTVTFVSRWGIDEYPARPSFFNYQVWAQAPHISQKVVEEIIAKFRTQFANIKTATEAKIPSVYVRNGAYDNGYLTLKIYNPIQAKSLTLKGTQALTETRERLPFNQNIALNGEEEETVKIFVGTVFDMGFTMKADKSEAYDALYFADGPWGLDYNKNNSTVEKFETINTIPTNETDLYTLERDPILRGQVKDYVSLFRSLRPTGAVADVSNFKNLSFIGSGTEVVDITLVKKSITDWSKQYRTEVRLDNERQQYRLAFADFSNGTSEPLKVDDVTNVVFTIKGDGQNVKTFEMNLQNVAFDNKDIKKMGQDSDIAVSPNPVSEVATLNFKMEERGAATITLSNTNGQTVITQKDTFAKGNNRMKLDVLGLVPGIYVVNIVSEKGTLKTKIVIP
jgi:hypothetical protein